jgi:hypothetical protein
LFPFFSAATSRGIVSEAQPILCVSSDIMNDHNAWRIHFWCTYSGLQRY